MAATGVAMEIARACSTQQSRPAAVGVVGSGDDERVGVTAPQSRRATAAMQPHRQPTTCTPART